MAAPVAIVTGGSSNIGWAIVQRLAATHEVFIGDVAPPKEELPARCRYVPWV